MSESESWPLQPQGDEEWSGLKDVAKLFGAGLGGGVLTLFGLGMLAMPMRTHGATRTLSIDRQKQQQCLELGITPEELEARERARAAAASPAPPEEPTVVDSLVEER